MVTQWLSIAGLVVVMTGLVLYTNHERNIGAARIVAQDAKLAAADRQHNADVKALADERAAKAGEIYVATTQLPAIVVPSVVCQRPRPAHQLPATAKHPGLPDGAAHGGETVALDLGPALNAGRNADALITALQAEIVILRDTMHGKTK